MPNDARCRQFADYIVDNFVTTDTDFPPTSWAYASNIMFVTTNGAEPYRGHLSKRQIRHVLTFTNLSRFTESALDDI